MHLDISENYKKYVTDQFYTTGAISGAGTALPYGALNITPFFSGICVA
jgi:hypothetical protein